MKIETYSVPREAPAFTPFGVNIILETQEEAQQFYSLFNMGVTVRAVPALDADTIRETLQGKFNPDSAAHQEFVRRVEGG